MKLQATYWLRRILFGGLFLAGVLPGFSQFHCSESLDQATVAYEQGDLDKVFELIKPCLEGKKFSREEKWKAHRLITLSHLYQDNKPEARLAAKELLKANPDYVPNGFIDGPDLVEFLAYYKALPLVTLGLRVGGEMQAVNVINKYSPVLTSQGQKNYKFLPGFAAGMAIDLRIFRSLVFSTGFNFVSKRVGYSANIADFLNLKYSENLNYGEIPVAFKIEFGHGKWIPWVRFGGSASYLFTSVAQIQREYTEIDKGNSDPEEIDMKPFRMSWDVNPLAAIGLGYRFGKNLVVGEIIYRHGLFSIVDANNRFSGDDPVFQGHVDDDFSMTNFAFQIGYNYMFYRVYTLKRPRRYRLEKD